MWRVQVMDALQERGLAMRQFGGFGVPAPFKRAGVSLSLNLIKDALVRLLLNYRPLELADHFAPTLESHPAVMPFLQSPCTAPLKSPLQSAGPLIDILQPKLLGIASLFRPSPTPLPRLYPDNPVAAFPRWWRN